MKITSKQISVLIALLVLATIFIFWHGCRKKPQVLRDPGDAIVVEPYVLPSKHPDNDHMLKRRFFQEPFRDLSDNMVQLDQYIGTPIVIVMFPAFLTPDGQKALLGLERLQHMREGQFKTVFIPVEDKGTIRPSIKLDPEGMMFLFKAGDEGNLSLIDRYSDLFWDASIIRADYPLDPPDKHHTSPFYWIVDETGTIREKLIDYSDKRGVTISEVAKVLDALLGELPQPETTEETVAEGEEVVNDNAGQESVVESETEDEPVSEEVSEGQGEGSTE